MNGVLQAWPLFFSSCCIFFLWKNRQIVQWGLISRCPTFISFIIVIFSINGIFSIHFAMPCWNQYTVLKWSVSAIYSKEKIPMDAWHVQLGHTRRPFDRSALYFCGFPTLQHIKHKVCFPMFGLESTGARRRPEHRAALKESMHQHWPGCCQPTGQTL